MKNRFNQVFAIKKPVIAMVHLGALPGSPLYNSEAGLDGLIEAARLDLHALQDAQVDAIMFGNENDRPYELKVDTASTSAAAYIIGQLKSEININMTKKSKTKSHTHSTSSLLYTIYSVHVFKCSQYRICEGILSCCI